MLIAIPPSLTTIIANLGGKKRRSFVARKEKETKKLEAEEELRARSQKKGLFSKDCYMGLSKDKPIVPTGSPADLAIEAPHIDFIFRGQL